MILIALFSLALVGAQGPPLPPGPTFTPPGVHVPDWHVRFDAPGVSDAAISFRGMNGGMHVTTGPAAVLWNDAAGASVPYTVDMYVLARVEPNRQQTYGIFIGGQRLVGGAPAYTAFVAREDGRFLIETLAGAERRVLVDWTENPAVARPDEKNDLYARLTIRVARDAVTFLSHDQTVATQPRSAVESQGVAGLRVLADADVHIRYFDVRPGAETP